MMSGQFPLAANAHLVAYFEAQEALQELADLEEWERADAERQLEDAADRAQRSDEDEWEWRMSEEDEKQWQEDKAYMMSWRYNWDGIFYWTRKRNFRAAARCAGLTVKHFWRKLKG